MPRVIITEVIYCKDCPFHYESRSVYDTCEKVNQPIKEWKGTEGFPLICPLPEMPGK